MSDIMGIVDWLKKEREKNIAKAMQERSMRQEEERARRLGRADELGRQQAQEDARKADERRKYPFGEG